MLRILMGGMRNHTLARVLDYRWASDRALATERVSATDLRSQMFKQLCECCSRNFIDETQYLRDYDRNINLCYYCDAIGNPELWLRTAFSNYINKF